MSTREQFGLPLRRNPAVELDDLVEFAISDIAFELRSVLGIARADDVKEALGNEIVNAGERV